MSGIAVMDGQVYQIEDAEIADLLRMAIDTWSPKEILAELRDMGIIIALPAVPKIDEVRPPMKNTDKAWYEYWRTEEPNAPHARYGCDWNLESMGDTDLGEPIVAPFNGVVINAGDYGGAMGRIVRIMGLCGDHNEVVVWMGAHFQEIASIVVGDIVAPGQLVGFIGKGPQGMYSAHLHEQISVSEVLGPTEFRFGGPFVDPVQWYTNHGVEEELMSRLVQKDER